MKYRIASIIILLAFLGIGFFIYRTEGPSSRFSFKYGLDLAGGSHLIYEADVASLSSTEVTEAMESLKAVIERRVNLFGVSEALVQVENAGTFGFGQGNRLIVELPGVTDLDKAIDMIGKTPLLEFKILNDTVMAKLLSEELKMEDLQPTDFVETGLTGRYLQKASLGFDQVSREPYVLINFNEEGRALFTEITKNNVGRVLAIYLDGGLLSTPIIREEIPNGQAQITGGFNPEEARTLVRDLNLGALPVPISLVSSQNVGATLGQKALEGGILGGIIGIAAVVVFMTLYYRIPGFIASIALLIYTVFMLAMFKLIGVTLTAAGIAGLIISVGMAVDANILIFERMKEEMQKGLNLEEALRRGFDRAWLSIRDGNIATILSAVVLFWFGTASVEGFALVLGIGVVVSMFTAITLTRPLLYSVLPKTTSGLKGFLFKVPGNK